MGVENPSVVQVVALLLLICLAVTRVKCQKPLLTCRVGCDNDFSSCIRKCMQYAWKDRCKLDACLSLCKPHTQKKDVCLPEYLIASII
jgi:hypothetical protein